MQYDRNDEITYDEDFVTNTNREYYSGNDDDRYISNEEVINPKSKKAIPTLILIQLIVFVLCGAFLYFSKTSAPDTFNYVMGELKTLINDSLIIDGNNVNDYFVNNG